MGLTTSTTCCPSVGILDAEGDRIAHQPGVVGHLLDLGRAHPVPGGLDHFVLAADEVQEPLLVTDHRVT